MDKNKTSLIVDFWGLLLKMLGQRITQTVTPWRNSTRAITHKTNQRLDSAWTGRSMLETLAVLAIIGVLSIVALIGYNTAIAKQQSNTILNDVRLIMVSTFTPNFSATDTTDIDVDVRYDGEYVINSRSEKAYVITLTFVSEDVCEQLIKETPDYLEAIVPSEGTCTDNSVINFYIHPKLTGGMASDELTTCDETKKCIGCAECVNGYCMDNDALCPTNAPNCTNGLCSCPSNKFFNTNTFTCANCSATIDVRIVKEACHMCSNQFYTEAGCFGCDLSWHLGTQKTTLENCNRCSNRFFDLNSSLCLKCLPGVFKGKTGLTCEETTLEECNQYPNRFFDTIRKSCALCPANSKKDETGLACECDAGSFFNMGAYYNSTQCSKCSDTTCVSATETECHKCSNQFADIQNNCYGCSESYWALKRVTTLENCNRCSNRYFDERDSICKICPNGTIKNATGTGCE